MGVDSTEFVIVQNPEKPSELSVSEPTKIIEVVTRGPQGIPGPMGPEGPASMVAGPKGDQGPPGSISNLTAVWPLEYDTNTNTLRVEQEDITDGGNF